MDWWDGTGWDHATTLCRGISCLRPRDGSISQLDGDESAKGFWVASDVSPTSGGTRIGGHPHSVSEAPGFCGTDWDWRLLILIATRANHDGEVSPPVDRNGPRRDAPLGATQHTRP